MNEIRAFVGHSFTTDDADIVGKFLKYFDQVKGLYPLFSWEHAEAAEPRELAAKVLSLIADKNVFIGICTKKENVSGSGSFKSLVFQPLYRKVKDADLQWKTSDWILQEIGLAIGRGLDLILLVEEELRQPGGLQGNVEYITFKRDEPEKSFGKILEMIRALSPRPTQLGTATSDAPTKDTSKQIAPTDDDVPNWTKPQPDWTQKEYARAMLRLIVRDHSEDMAKLNEAYLGSRDAEIGDNKSEWHANVEYLRILVGKGGNLDKLKEISEDTPKNRNILFYLAMAQEGYDKHVEAAQTFEAAALVADDDADRQSMLGFAATNRAQAGDTVIALSMLDDLRRASSADPKIERDVLGTLRRAADVLKNDDSAVAVMERIVEIAPDDIDTRFSLAYKHSEMGNEDLALHHYLKIPFKQRSPVTWNNLGVSFDHFGMPAKSVRSYRRAEELGETLAMSNLGYKFMGAGFVEEARQEFDRALAIKDYHKNVSHGLARLKDIPDEEDKDEHELLEGMKRKAEFYRLLGRAVSQPSPAQLSTRWHGPDCELTVSISGNKVRAVGAYERAAVGLIALTSSPKVITKYQLEYEGALNGRLIDGTVRRVREGGNSVTLLGLGTDDIKSKVLIAIGDAGILMAIENPHSTSPTYYEMRTT